MKTLALLILAFLQLSSFGVESLSFNEAAVLDEIYTLIAKRHVTRYPQAGRAAGSPAAHQIDN